MTRLARPGLWYLFDYGMVISTAPEPGDWQALRRATGVDLDLQAASSPYWRHREEFDGGRLTPEQYWSRVLGRAAGGDVAALRRDLTMPGALLQAVLQRAAAHE